MNWQHNPLSEQHFTLPPERDIRWALEHLLSISFDEHDDHGTNECHGR